MKKLISIFLTAAMLLSLCGIGTVPAAAAETEPAEAAASEAPAEDPMAPYRTGKPWLCLDLDGVVTENTAAELKDDFALYVNRDFYLTAGIPEGYYSTGTVDDLIPACSDDLVRLFQDDNSFDIHDSKIAKTFYDLILDWDARDALGVAPLKEETDVIEDMETLDDLIAYYRDYPVEKQLSAPFGAFMDTDLIDPELYIAVANSCRMLLKDSAEYSELTDLGSRYRSAYGDLASAILVKLGYSEERAREMWEEAIHLDELMAPAVFTTAQTQSPDYLSKVNNHLTRDEMIALQGRLPVVEFIETACGYGKQENWLVLNPGFFEAMQTIFTEENLPLLKSWIICHAALDESVWLDRDCMELRWACNLAIVGSTPLPDEAVAVQLTQDNLPWEVSHMYCDQYFTQHDKDVIRGVIDDVIATYKEMLRSEEFISDATKAAALKKLDTMRIRTLYPDDWSKYTDPDLTFRSPAEGGSLKEAREAIDCSDLRYMQEMVKMPADPDRWSDEMVPTTVNACYISGNNSINILAAYCRGDAYSEDMSREEIYGKIGSVIGHEITHAFDANGSQFDETGAFRDWWTEEDKALFNEKNKRLADYFSSISLWDGENVNGEIKQGEACADMGAMKCLLTMAAAQKDFDYDAFFRSYAEFWRCKAGMFYVQYIQTDTHPMSYLRINTVLQQFDEFLDFYGITEGDGMYLSPEDRVAIW